MSCYSASLLPHHQAFLGCSYDWFRAQSSNVSPQWLSAIGLFITLVITIHTQRFIKKAETFIAFTNTFNEFMKERQDLTDAPAAAPPDDRRREKANSFYGRFYGLLFTEFYAYRMGTLNRKMFTLWMQSRFREFKDDQTKPMNQIHGVDYRTGYTHWHQYHYPRDADDPFTRLITAIQTCNYEYRVPLLVRKYGGPGLQPLLWLVFLPFVEAIHGARRLWTRRQAIGDGIVAAFSTAWVTLKQLARWIFVDILAQWIGGIIFRALQFRIWQTPCGSGKRRPPWIKRSLTAAVVLLALGAAAWYIFR